MFYMGQSDYDSRTIRLDDVYTAVYESNYGSIQFGDNYYDASTDYAFSLVDTSDYQTRTSFGAYGVSVRGGYGGSYDHAEFGNYITQMRGMTSDGVENYVVMYNSGIDTNGYLQATNGDIYYTSIYPTGVDTTGSIHVSDGSRTYAYLSQSGLNIYGDASYMTLSASSIGFWDNEHQTGSVLSFDEFRAVKNAMPRYPFVDAAIVEGVVTVAPYSNAKIVSDGTVFSVAVGGESGKTRDCVLRVECGKTAPKITWPTNFHPRTDKDTDFACVAGVRNVYWITEYASGEFCVAGWQETEGGNAE
jgi:hypothetical protein